MKKLNILIAVLSLLTFVACDNDGDRILLGDESSYVKPVLEQNIVQNFVIDKNTDLTKEAGSWSWNKADYGIQTGINYVLEMATTADFSNKKTLSSTTGTSIKATYDMLNKAASEYMKESGEVTLYIRLKSGLGATDNYLTYYSETKSVTFTCYISFPKELYMIGADFGSWDWSSAGVVAMTPIQNNKGEDGAFWCVRYFTKDHGFKWSPDKTWDTAFGKMTTNTGFTNDGDGNAVVATDGFYVVFINYVDKAISVEPAKIYGMGEAFGGWVAGDYPFTTTGNKATIKTAAAKNLRMFVSSTAIDAYGSDWWRHEFNLFDGKIVYRGTGGDQAAVPVDAGKTITLDFNAGTGTIE
ncbi:MAG: SusF/SusE family outer membrane protein [Dysgonomonas sp.]